MIEMAVEHLGRVPGRESLVAKAALRRGARHLVSSFGNGVIILELVGAKISLVGA
jgi:hypothetical protein